MPIRIVSSWTWVAALAGTLAFVGGNSTAQSVDEIEAVSALFEQIQPDSFEANREFCGMIGLDEAGAIVVGAPLEGELDSCTPEDPDGAVDIVASYHTHGAFDAEYDAEMPSVDDVLSDMEEGVDGWVATPGGRLWFIDGQEGVIYQVCGLGCLPQDPDFIPGLSGPIPEEMTLEELEHWFDG